MQSLETVMDLGGKLPAGSFLAGGLFLAWFLNRWLNDRALNNGNAPSSYDWAKEIIVVTGGSGGIGAETVKKLAGRGSQIVVLDVLPLSYSNVPNVHYYECDLTKYDELQEVGKRISKEIGDPTVVIANAGICRGKPILSASKRDIELTFGVNNIALLFTAKTFLPSMVAKNHGHFLIIASQTGYIATPGLTDYSASKAATIAIYEGLHAEVGLMYGAPSVRVSCVSPTLVDTKMFQGMDSSAAPGGALRPEDLGARIAGIIHSGRAQHACVPHWSVSPLSFIRTWPDWLRVWCMASSVGLYDNLRPHDPMASR
ncbi:hypothetical protein M0657_006518 [Pyricularia oryzae]|nr:hypothetical protein MCOR11_007594 [Pyricularia oryzae]KAI7918865.1 hypothetical protein M9X92_006650 [Pyricularia oryzae]KAI7920557.1 hypothetical protein M0657_006518 [Pyricularia oryzae]